MKFLKGISRSISGLDFVGYHPKLLYRGKTNTQTILGGIISTCTVGFLMGFCIFFIIQLFERQNSSITSNDRINFFPEFNMSKLPFIFKLVNGDGFDVANDTSVFNWEGIFSSNKAYNFKFEPCNITNIKHFGGYNHSFWDRIYDNISTYNCIDDLYKYNFNLLGLYEDNETPHTFINIIIQMCKNVTLNSTLKPPICKSQSKINSILQSVYIKIFYLDYTINHDNINSPGKIIVQTDIFPVSSSIYKRFFMYKSLIKYETDYGYVFPDIKSEKYFQQRSTDVSVDLRVQNGAAKFAQISIYMCKFETKYERKYTKIQEVIASVGGVFSAILFAAQLIVGFVSKRIFLIRLANDSYIQKSKDKKRGLTVAAFSEINYNMKDIAEEGKASMLTSLKSPSGKTVRQTELVNINKDIILDSNKIMETKNFKTENYLDEQKIEEKKPKIKKIPNVFTKISNQKKYDLSKIVDENGKIKISFKNIFFPCTGLKKVYEIMERKSGIDEVLMYCSQVEKIKKYMFRNDEEQQIFNNLPDLDLIDIFPDTGDLSNLKESINKLIEKKPDAKILELFERI